MNGSGVPEREQDGGPPWDKRALRFAIIFPILLCLGMVAGGFLLRSELPGGVELPTGGGKLPLPVFLGIASAVTLVVGIGIGMQGARTRLSTVTRRLLLGLAMTLQLSTSALFSAALLGQLANPGHSEQRVDGYVVLMGCGLAVALGVILALAFKPEEQWTSADDAALAAELERESDPQAAKDRLSYWSHPRSSVVIMILLGGLFPGGLLSIITPWFLLGFALLAVAAVAFTCALVSVDRTALTVKLAGLIKVIEVPCENVQGSVSLDIKAGDYGGWGLRKQSGKEQFLAASGAAVVLRTVSAERVVVSAPSLDVADELSAILNRRAGKDPSRR